MLNLKQKYAITGVSLCVWGGWCLDDHRSGRLKVRGRILCYLLGCCLLWDIHQCPKWLLLRFYRLLWQWVLLELHVVLFLFLFCFGFLEGGGVGGWFLLGCPVMCLLCFLLSSFNVWMVMSVLLGIFFFFFLFFVVFRGVFLVCFFHGVNLKGLVCDLNVQNGLYGFYSVVKIHLC